MSWHKDGRGGRDDHKGDHKRCEAYVDEYLFFILMQSWGITVA